MKLGIIGRNWGNAYARTCDKLGIPYWQAGREWGDSADGVIVATPAGTHYEIARQLLPATPIILEKPVTLDVAQARELVALGGIAFAGHTRLHDPSWRSFKASLPPVESVRFRAGGTTRNPWWDWGPHAASMCLDIGFDPRKADIQVSHVHCPLSFTANGQFEFVDGVSNPSPLEVLLTEFVEAIRLGKPNNAGLVMGAEIVEFLHESRGLHGG